MGEIAGRRRPLNPEDYALAKVLAGLAHGAGNGAAVKVLVPKHGSPREKRRNVGTRSRN